MALILNIVIVIIVSNHEYTYKFFAPFATMSGYAFAVLVTFMII
jgi:hypothetical protein